MKFFDDNGNVLFERLAKYHKPYFITLQNLKIPYDKDKIVQKIVDFSFVAEHIMVKSNYMLKLIQTIESTHNKPFWKAILDSVHDCDLECGFSEFETYGNFIACAYPKELATITRKRDRCAKQVIGFLPMQAQIKWYGKYYDVCSIEHWDCEMHPLPKLTRSKIIRLISPKLLRKFYKIYKILRIHRILKH